MSFVRLSSEYNLSAYTLVDNVFLHEYMPTCPDGALKIYLFGLYATQAGDKENTLENFCIQLKVTEEDVFNAYAYFEEFGLVSVLSRDPLCVNYLPLSGLLAKPRKIKPQKYSEFTKQIQALLPERMITTAEFSEYFNLIETYHIQQEALTLIIQYCTKLKDKSISYKYISTVAKNWAARGITSLEACEQELSTYNRQSTDIADIIKAMGLRASADFSDSELYTKWTTELGFSKPALLFAAKKLKGNRPSMAKLDESLIEFYKYRKFSPAEMEEYSTQKYKLRELAITINRALGEYVSDLSPVIENYINPWSDAGFEPETLLTVAGYCFTSGIRSLVGLDKFLKKLRSLGLITLPAISEYIEVQVEKERTIRRILDKLGIEREVNSFDRSNYHTWSTLWGMSDELIFFAASRSIGLSPIKTMHQLLSIYKTQHINSIDEASTVVLKSENNFTTQKKTTSFDNYDQRTYSKEELGALFEDVDEWEQP